MSANATDRNFDTVARVLTVTGPGSVVLAQLRMTTTTVAYQTQNFGLASGFPSIITFHNVP
ncbi:hypothetical protein [Paraburkholderia hospita]|uniref:Uncharacterized protein n=1 Tax=Paraburkholderia hospita TaxID=169430 RepID=A0AAN1JD90_9BURK|nr:hypothetical protein [Paraburkholderia hospita]AUT70787.1 hypothetical protein C2L64_20690 [Paraburkholderia hospita]EIM94439.1 hypothetical protein WQE_44493 [Paraburkholderia hospita]OUL84166.1 hypothetical protein CA602_20595 [Paraburkholderia hospita]OUL95867.1 hypothetical protein CA601_04060 [Paraburkholderia hospita]